jgi:hypothetical protein
VSPVRPLDQAEGLEGQDTENASHLVGVAFGRVGLSGLEPLTSALSGQRSNRLSYRPAWVVPGAGTKGKVIRCLRWPSSRLPRQRRPS